MSGYPDWLFQLQWVMAQGPLLEKPWIDCEAFQGHRIPMIDLRMVTWNDAKLQDREFVRTAWLVHSP